MFRLNSRDIGQGSKYFLHVWCGEKYFCLRSYDLQGTGRTCHMSHEETERNIFAFDPMTSKAWVERVTCHIRIRCCIIHRALPSRTPHQSSDRTLQRGFHINHQIERCNEDCTTLTAAINPRTHPEGREAGGPAKTSGRHFCDQLRIQRRINDRGLPSRISCHSSDRTLRRGLRNSHRREKCTHSHQGAGSGRTAKTPGRHFP